VIALAGGRSDRRLTERDKHRGERCRRCVRPLPIASVIATDAYFPNAQTSNGEAKGIEDEGKIKMMKARSNNRAANRGHRLARAAIHTYLTRNDREQP
jgi:hypothetical protein